MQLYGVMGWPVGHSASPAMLNAAFRETGQSAVYVPFPVPPERIGEAVHGLAAVGAAGFNVTIPHKQAVFALLDEVTEVARLAGAVNTVRIDPESRHMAGHNTDVDGWWESVRPHLTGLPERVVVLGAGGAARAVLTALALYAQAAEVRVVARRFEQAEALVHAFSGRLRVQAVAWEARHLHVGQADLVAQTTPIGMWPHDSASPLDDARCFRPGQVVQDAVYRPLLTRFMTQAADRGARVVDGLEMLVQQGVMAYRFWLGTDPPVAVMRAAARDVVQP
ncbi:MAG: shikimate dehydrogenase [Alicyclobacillus sp.]|nr:shikimate dehydrogenase [Alicyclobacillus sp.]